MLIRHEIISRKFSAFLLLVMVCASLQGCTSRLATRQQDEILDKSLTRVIRKIGFFLLTMNNSNSDSSLKNQLYHEIMVDLEIVKKRAQITQRESVSQIEAIEQGFQATNKINKIYYASDCSQCPEFVSVANANGHEKFCDWLIELEDKTWHLITNRYKQILAQK